MHEPVLSHPVINVFFLLIRLPPDFTLFPYTTLFRSRLRHGRGAERLPTGEHRHVRDAPHVRRDRAGRQLPGDRKSTRLNSSHTVISYAVFCLKKKNHSKRHRKPSASAWTCVAA